MSFSFRLPEALPTRSRPAIFLDRDGTLNRDTGYLIQFRDFEALPGVEEALLLMQDLGYALFVVTNQSGVARGYFTLEQVMELHWRIRDYFGGKGIMIADFVLCPHHPEGSVPAFTQKCLCRKPSPGMILSLMERYHIDASSSYMVGDRLIDVKAGQAAGVQGVKIGTQVTEAALELDPGFGEYATLQDFARNLEPADMSRRF